MTKFTVYQVTNLLNGRIYVGVHKTQNPTDSYLGSGKLIRQAIKKHGRKAFRKDVLFEFNSAEEAYAKEKEIVGVAFVNDSATYNLIAGGAPTVEWSSERRESYRKRVGPAHAFYGKKHTEETKRRISEAGRGRIRSPETIEKTASKRRGKPSPIKGIPQSIESNTKRSKSHLSLSQVQCPHCQKWCCPGNAKQWHFDRCNLVNPTKRLSRTITCPHCDRVGVQPGIAQHIKACRRVCLE